MIVNLGCLYCGSEFISEPQAIAEHLNTCSKHPLYQTLISTDADMLIQSVYDQIQASIFEAQIESKQLEFKW